MFDDWGETLGGFTDTLLNGGKGYIDTWFASESDKLVSSAPEENRVPDEQQPAQQPTGEPIYAGQPQDNTMLYVVGGVAALALVLTAFSLAKG